jgi:TrmH family RNA methyltransferase
MIGKAKIKYIHSLEQKKHRKEEGVFVAEGPKIVGDLLKLLNPTLIVATQKWLLENNVSHNCEVIEATAEELRKVSFLQHPQQVLAVFPQFKNETDKNLVSLPTQKLTLALDDVQDPGNLGTIIRIADWFGIENIVCSMDTADIYNPKVIQATMGSIARVKITYTDLKQYLKQIDKSTPIYRTLLDGKNIYQQELSSHGLIIMGNEGKGISPDIAAMVTHKLLIPNYPEGKDTADSLNVAIATAITCSEFRRYGNRHF